MRLLSGVAAIWLLAGVPAAAQIPPYPGFGDARIQSLDYRPDQVVPIRAAIGYQVTVELASDERITTIAVGDSAAWQVTASKGGNHLFVKPTQAGVATNMTVVTNVRTYAFDLVGVDGSDASLPYTVRFRYPAPFGGQPVGLPMTKANTAIGFYRLSGDRPLRPSRISDDGVRTSIEWPADVPLPAVYARDANGREGLTNGYMRDGVFVIDSVTTRLVFRIDNRVARADRLRQSDPKR